MLLAAAGCYVRRETANTAAALATSSNDAISTLTTGQSAPCSPPTPMPVAGGCGVGLVVPAACVGAAVAPACCVGVGVGVAVGVLVAVAVAVVVAVAVPVEVAVAVAVLVEVAVAVAVAVAWAAWTTTVPDILAPWTLQLYVYVPTVSNVNANVSPDPERSPLLKLSGPLSDVTVWGSESATVQVTVSPGFIVTEDVVGSDQDTASSSALAVDAAAASRTIATASPAAMVRLHRWLIMHFLLGFRRQERSRTDAAETRGLRRALGAIERDRGLSLLP
jgi:hypothetical protein